MTMEASSGYRSAIDHGLHKLGVSVELKQQQLEAVSSFLQGRDTFVNLPTGYGKSVIYQLAPFCVDFIKSQQGTSTEGTTIAVVISPLIALMKDQVKMLRENGVKAGYIGDIKEDAIERAQLQQGQFSLVFSSPETLLGPFGRSLLTSPSYQQNLCGFFVDEGHCVAKWGMKSGKVEAFRSCYSHLAELRSLVPRSVVIMALTATASPDMRKTIETSLGMSDTVTLIAVSPERTNIKYSVVNTKVKDPQVQYGWLMKELELHGQATPKVIIFCQSHRYCRELHAAFEDVVEEKLWKHVAIFHSCTDDKQKEIVLKEFTKNNGSIRILIATVAFGMGINVQELYHVIHHGPSRDIDDYFQETGRVGRDNKQSYAVLLTYPGCYSACRIGQRMKDYINSGMCRRQILLEYYGYPCQRTSDYVKHLCCDNCFKECLCGGDDCCWVNVDWCTTQFQNLKKQSAVGDGSFTKDVHVRQVTDSQRNELKQKLISYRDSLLHGQACSLYTGVEIASGMSHSLIDMILSDCHLMFSSDQFSARYPLFSRAQASALYSIVSDTLGSDISSAALVASSDHEEESDTSSSQGTCSDDAGDETDEIGGLRRKFNVVYFSNSSTCSESTCSD